jgi:predicted transcriptional regulator
LLHISLNCAIRHRRRLFMPETETRSVFEIEPDAATEARLDAQAEADYAAGRVVSQERVLEWLEKLARGERVPRPRA